MPSHEFCVSHSQLTKEDTIRRLQHIVLPRLKLALKGNMTDPICIEENPEWMIFKFKVLNDSSMVKVRFLKQSELKFTVECPNVFIKRLKEGIETLTSEWIK